jgi:hypothetical protein
MRKKGIVVLALVALALTALLIGCDALTEETEAQVRFQNNRTDITVDAIWDGSRVATLAPGGISKYRTENEGTHTCCFQDTSGAAVTSTSSPNLVAGHKYTFSCPAQ